MWYEVRKKRRRHAPHPAPGRARPGFNDDFGDTFGIIYGFTADGFTHRELRDHVEDAARACCWCRMSRRSRSWARRTSASSSISRPRRWPGSGSSYGALIAALQAQNAGAPGRRAATGEEALSLRVSGAFENEADVLATSTSWQGGGCCACATWPRCAAATPTRRSRCSA
jgi:multidrug efflux pump